MKHLPLILICVFILLFLKKRFFDTTDYKSMIENGALIIDVRSESEFLSGNINGSINIPLNSITNKLDELQDKNQPIITCCASGMRSAAAKNVLKAKGYKHVVNGGGWNSLKNKIK